LALIQDALLFYFMLYTIAQVGVAGPLLSRVTWALLKLVKLLVVYHLLYAFAMQK